MTKRDFIKLSSLTFLELLAVPNIHILKNKKLYLTIDDGADGDAILNFSKGLKDSNQFATGFFCGYLIYKNLDEIREFIKNGNEFACHSMYHKESSKLTEKEFIEDIKSFKGMTSDLLGEKIAKSISHYRFPYGDTGGKNKDLFEKILKEEGMKSVLWDIDLTFSHPKAGKVIQMKESEKIKTLEKLTLEENKVILMHFNKEDSNSISSIIKYVSDKGFKFDSINSKYS